MAGPGAAVRTAVARDRFDGRFTGSLLVSPDGLRVHHFP